MIKYKTSEASCDFDFDLQGKNYGELRLANADARLGNRIPIITIANGSGPTALLCAGSHGNEDEGQLILRRLIHEIEPDDVQGRIIFLPALNYPAVRACTRTSPLDGGNLNRSFPGEGANGPTRAIAKFIVDVLLPLADAGMDLHSAAYASKFVDTTFLCLGSNSELNKKSLEMADAFQAPYMYVVNNTNNTRNFDSAAHSQNVTFVSAELGGGGIDLKTIDIGYRGIRNVLSHLNITGNPESIPSPNSTTYLTAGDRSSGVQAPYEGLFEARFEEGDEVKEGQLAGVLYSLDEVDREPTELFFKESGVVFFKSLSARVVYGSSICATAKVFSHEEILSLTHP